MQFDKAVRFVGSPGNIGSYILSRPGCYSRQGEGEGEVRGQCFVKHDLDP